MEQWKDFKIKESDTSTPQAKKNNFWSKFGGIFAFGIVTLFILSKNEFSFFLKIIIFILVVIIFLCIPAKYWKKNAVRWAGPIIFPEQNDQKFKKKFITTGVICLLIVIASFLVGYHFS